MKVNNRYVSFYYENDNDYGKIEIDPKKTALLVVDMQHVFITRKKLENPSETELADAARWEQFYEAIDSTVVPNNRR
jgi:isochorismate hydrolase